MCMNIMIAANSKYLFPTIVMLDSLFSSNEEAIDVYLLYSDMKVDEIRRLCLFAESYPNKRIVPVRIEEKYTRGLFPAVLSIEAYYRILGMELVPKSLDRILYLDVDMIIKKSLKDFYDIDLNHKALAACKDIYAYVYGVADSNLKRCEMPASEVYFNSGVMLYNLEYLRENQCMKQILEFVYENHARLTYMDQDALNHILHGKIRFVDWNRYNCPPVWYICAKKDVENGCYQPYSKKELEENEIDAEQCLDMTSAFYDNAAVIHYIGETKPWIPNRVSSHAYKIFDSSFHERYERAVNRFCI